MRAKRIFEFERGRGIKKSLEIGKASVEKKIRDFLKQKDWSINTEVGDDLKVTVKSDWTVNVEDDINTLGRDIPDLEFNIDFKTLDVKQIDWDIVERSVDIDELSEEDLKYYYSFKLYHLLVDEELDPSHEEVHELSQDIDLEEFKQFKPVYAIFRKKQKELGAFFKEYRDEYDKMIDEDFGEYYFIGKPGYKEIEVNGRTLHDKTLEIENLYQVDRHDPGSSMAVAMMKMRAPHADGKVYKIHIPRFMHDAEYAYDDDISDELRDYIIKNKKPA